MPRLRPTPTIEPQRYQELTTLLKSASLVDRLLTMWKCAPNTTTFIARATEAGYNSVVINLFLSP